MGTRADVLMALAQNMKCFMFDRFGMFVVRQFYKEYAERWESCAPEERALAWQAMDVVGNMVGNGCVLKLASDSFSYRVVLWHMEFLFQTRAHVCEYYGECYSWTHEAILHNLCRSLADEGR